jgi:hypothetical protein
MVAPFRFAVAEMCSNDGRGICMSIGRDFLRLQALKIHSTLTLRYKKMQSAPLLGAARKMAKTR